MEYVTYAERAAALLNAAVSTPDELRDLLSDREWLARQVVDADPRRLLRFQRELRPVFETARAGDDAGAVALINTLLDKHPVTPHIAGEATGDWHLHVSNKKSSVAELLVAEALLGLAFLVCDLGASRLGVCQAPDCDDVFVDTSSNQTRRYSSERCASRANVAAYRARQRSAMAAPATIEDVDHPEARA